MKEILVEMIETLNPKSLSQAVMRKKDLFEWIKKSTTYLDDNSTLAERIYNIINGPGERICQQGKIKKFRDMKYGYMFCGKAGTCPCNKNQISQKVSETKSQFTKEQIEASNKKREETNTKVHGHPNAGQTPKARKNHAEFYSKPENVAVALENYKASMIKNHGEDNPAKVKEITKKRAKAHKITYYKNRPKLQILQNKEEFSKLYNEHIKTGSIGQLANDLDVASDTIYRYSYKYGLREKFKSIDEKQLEDFIRSLGIENIVCNSRKIIPPNEIDIFLPDYNIAIEYNGVHWHRDGVCDKNYHHMKYKRCREKGIQLITIFSTTWHYSKDLVKNRLISKLGLTNETVYARKCNIVEISARIANKFHKEHHIQGASRACVVHYGLIHNNEIVSVMSFSNESHTKGRKNKVNDPDVYELCRFSSKCNVPGGAGKLFKHFVKMRLPKKVLSYSDNMWNTGKVYEHLGFKLSHETEPSYWYVDDDSVKLEHRSAYQRHTLRKQGFDPSKTLTEFEIMDQRGYYRVWDCGNKVWVWSSDGKGLSVEQKEIIDENDFNFEKPVKKSKERKPRKKRARKIVELPTTIDLDPIEEIKSIIQNSPSQSVVRVATSRHRLWKEVEKYCEPYTFEKKSEMIYIFANQLTPPVCKCGSNLRLPFNNINDGYRQYCGLSCKLKTKERMESQDNKGGVGFTKDWVRKKSQEQRC